MSASTDYYEEREQPSWSNPHNDAHQWGVWKDNGEYGEVRYCLDCDATDHRRDESD